MYACAYFVSKQELLESQMRKVQLENSTLHTENKLLKDKYNRATGKDRFCKDQRLWVAGSNNDGPL